MDQTPTTQGTPEAPQSSRLSRIEIIEQDLIALTRMTAQTAARLKIKNDIPDEDHVYVIMAIDNLYLLAYEILPQKTREVMDAYKKSLTQASDKRRTVEAAEALIKALDDQGISKFRQEEIEPPFMLEEVPANQ